MADSVLQGDGSKLVLTQSLKNAKTQKENLQVILFQREIINRKAHGIPSRTPQRLKMYSLTRVKYNSIECRNHMIVQNSKINHIFEEWAEFIKKSKYFCQSTA